MNRLCLPLSLNEAETLLLDDIVQRSTPIHRGGIVYEEGEPFTNLYALRSGALKGYRHCSNGNIQITDFVLPGEVFGLDGVSSGKHQCSVQALETASVCALPFDLLQQLGRTLPILQTHLMEAVSGCVQAKMEHLCLVTQYSAYERIKALILNLSKRYASLGQSALHFRLPMSRADIGCHLGMTIETVSRCLSRLREEQVITLDNREIRILKPEALRSTARPANKP
ncbi:helix-turn-helix domain-containing protein [Parahaliea mediterranea]|uniref:helix-turn-helix domain-containing protein n=1 Tax=Parahaliea mediterranea TaxID=651086 RepID=UPI0013004A50|nr:helix-turn-helix domain-containing protein [Parahaliea mediterranea]